MRRSKREIKLEMLETCMKPTLRTHVYYRCNLNSGVCVDWFKQLKNKGLLESIYLKPNNFKKKKEYFKTTGQGKEAVYCWTRVKELLEN